MGKNAEAIRGPSKMNLMTLHSGRTITASTWKANGCFVVMNKTAENHFITVHRQSEDMVPLDSKQMQGN